MINMNEASMDFIVNIFFVRLISRQARCVQ